MPIWKWLQPSPREQLFDLFLLQQSLIDCVGDDDLSGAGIDLCHQPGIKLARFIDLSKPQQGVHLHLPLVRLNEVKEEGAEGGV